MPAILTKDELIQKIDNLGAMLIPHLAEKMKEAALVVEGQAKRNCTLGQSPYEDMVFPTKMEAYERTGKTKMIKMTTQPSVFVAEEGAYSGAPYSISQEAIIHMRDTIYSEVDQDQAGVHGLVGTPKDYSLWVHEGTSKMWARPFITDAIAAKEKTIRKLLSEAVEDTLQEQAE